MPQWDLTDRDKEFFASELNSFLPERVFDVHAHLYAAGDWGGPVRNAHRPDQVGLADYREQLESMLPGRSASAIFFGVAFNDGYAQANEFVSSELRKDPTSRGHMLAPPDLDPEFLRETAQRLGFSGLKVYHLFAAREKTFEADIAEFLPEQYMRVANEEHWTITLHIVRARALADPANQQWIRWAAEKFPNVKIILAHAARGFNAHHTAEGINAIAGLNNVWFDTSAIAESLAFEAVIDVFGPERLLWASDYPISHRRGRCVSVGDDFVWLDSDAVDFRTVSGLGAVRPYFVGHESIRALKQAAKTKGLTDTDVEGIFWDNAIQMFELN